MATAKPRSDAPDERETDEFEIPGFGLDPDTDGAARLVSLYKPNEMQMKTLARVGEVATRTGGTWRTISLTDQMLASLFVRPEDWEEFEELMVGGKVSHEEYTELILEIMRRFFGIGEQEEAPRTGPRPTKRAARARR